jgi:hypothetical protein
LVEGFVLCAGLRHVQSAFHVEGRSRCP